ncbi:hypothetical protein LPJ61_002353 [Coemansia biformis]|uniref:Uncharacterized protein n=1 Tax=Coemansia biformis TaxID=1286918 RepID=A0A9W7YCM7_9FUNG|nr:hypothetical protein LPJ61_002353 [Coemansia biformis]
MMTTGIFARVASAATRGRTTALQRMRSAAAAPAVAVRAYTRPEAPSSEAGHLDPVDMHKFLQGRDRLHREFLDDESEMIVTESFFFDVGAPPTTPAKPVNSEFAKQIQELLKPEYGTEGS